MSLDYIIILMECTLFVDHTYFVPFFPILYALYCSNKSDTVGTRGNTMS